MVSSDALHAWLGPVKTVRKGRTVLKFFFFL